MPRWRNATAFLVLEMMPPEEVIPQDESGVRDGVGAGREVG